MTNKKKTKMARKKKGLTFGQILTLKVIVGFVLVVSTFEYLLVSSSISNTDMQRMMAIVWGFGINMPLLLGFAVLYILKPSDAPHSHRR